MPDGLRGLKVTVREGDATPAFVRRKGAIAVRAEDLRHVAGLLAAPAWLLHKRGLTPTKFILFEKKHIMAVPPGENGWLKCLSQLMNRRPSTVEDQEEDPATDKLQKTLEKLDWVAKARVRLRDDGDVLTGEAFIEPRGDHDLLNRMARRPGTCPHR